MSEKACLYRASALLGVMLILLSLNLSASVSAQPDSQAARSTRASAWTVVPSPVTDMLYAITMTSSLDGWAGGGKGTSNNGRPLGTTMLHWDGNTWSQAALVGTNIFSTDIHAITMLSPSDGWAVSGLGYHFFTDSTGQIFHWDGSAWTAAAGMAEGLYGLAAISPADVWAVGVYYRSHQSGGAYYHWDGSAWTGDIRMDLSGLFSIAMLSQNNGWAVGGYLTPTCQIFHWDGAGWTRAPLSFETYAYLKAIAMVSSTDGWAVGEGGLILHWDGNTWDQFSSPVIEDLNAISMLSESDGWIVGKNGTILHWDGSAWTQQESPVTERLNGVTFLNPNEGWIVGDKGTILRYGTPTYRAFLPGLVNNK